MNKKSVMMLALIGATVLTVMHFGVQAMVKGYDKEIAEAKIRHEQNEKSIQTPAEEEKKTDEEIIIPKIEAKVRKTETIAQADDEKPAEENKVKAASVSKKAEKKKKLRRKNVKNDEFAGAEDIIKSFEDNYKERKRRDEKIKSSMTKEERKRWEEKNKKEKANKTDDKKEVVKAEDTDGSKNAKVAENKVIQSKKTKEILKKANKDGYRNGFKIDKFVLKEAKGNWEIYDMIWFATHDKNGKWIDNSPEGIAKRGAKEMGITLKEYKELEKKGHFKNGNGKNESTGGIGDGSPEDDAGMDFE